MHIVYPWIQKDEYFYFVIPFYCEASNIVNKTNNNEIQYFDKDTCFDQVLELLTVNDTSARFIIELEWNLVITRGEEVFIKKNENEIKYNYNNEDILLKYGRFNNIQEYKYIEFTIATHDDYRYKNIDNLIDKTIDKNEIEKLFYNLELYRLLDLKSEIK